MNVDAFMYTYNFSSEKNVCITHWHENGQQSRKEFKLALLAIASRKSGKIAGKGCGFQRGA